METRLDALPDGEWRGCREILLFGYGRQGKRVLRKLKKDFRVVAVVENDIHKTGMAEGIPVVHFQDALPFLKDYKIVVTVSEHYYREIKKQLEQAGLREYRDFAMSQQFIAEWYFKYRNETVLLKTDVSVTPRCTLNCGKCTFFMPYWKDRREKNTAAVKKDLDLYFKAVDYVLDMDIVGGEPFLYSRLGEILAYAGKHYRDRIGYLGVITNGTVIPSDGVLEVMREYNVGVSVSDYTGEVDYKDRIEQLCRRFEEYGITYIRNVNMDWFDFGFPDDVYHYSGPEAEKHMRACNTVCHTLDDGKIFYCITAWAAYKAGLFPLHGNDYVSLEDMDIKDASARKEILEHCLGNVKNGCLEFCKVCGGYGNDNRNKVTAGRQLVTRVAGNDYGA